jgi:hypothetical protein
MESTTRIRDLNDNLRKTFTGGRLLLTPGISGLEPEHLNGILSEVRTFQNFSQDNDPWSEHDFGAFDFNGVRYFWKIDYYAPDLRQGSEDPSDPARTCRVLTVMRADEY